MADHPVRFNALCPTCGREVDQGIFQAEALREFLSERTLRFFCPRCAAEWRPSERELKRIERLLTQPLTPA